MKKSGDIVINLIEGVNQTNKSVKNLTFSEKYHMRFNKFYREFVKKSLSLTSKNIGTIKPELLRISESFNENSKIWAANHKNKNTGEKIFEMSKYMEDLIKILNEV